jgi:hypothetical protein
MNLFKKIKILPVVAALFLMVGCASIDPQPFEKFNASLVELDKGATSSLDVTIPMSEKRYRIDLVNEIMNEKDDLLNDLSVEEKVTDPFYVSDSPLFLLAQRFKLGISKTNMVWLEYSKLLVQLSSKELVDENEFVELSTKLNEYALDAIQTFKDDPSNTSAENSALFSEVAVGFAREFIKTKTKEKLTKSITENQGSIESYVSSMQVAIVSMAQISTHEYSEKQQELKRDFISLVFDNVDGKKDVKVQKAITDMVEVKRMHSSQMTSLQALHAAYGRIPEAHKALAKRLKSSDESIAAISALLEKGIQMHASYEAKAKVNKAELVQAKADAANSQAAATEFKYQQAELKASQAQFDYTLAQNELNLDPDNAEKKQDVEDKKAKADELRLEADKLKESAVALRAAATAIQESANEVKSSITEN